MAAPQARLVFVVQHHMARRDHYDFRLEWGGALLSWAVPKGPSYDTRDKRLAVQVEEHPLDYKDFEGTIPKGAYGGGVVMIWDEGEWEPQGDVEAGLRQGSLKFTLKGSRLKGKWALVRLKARAGETGENWLLLKEKDAYANGTDDIAVFTTSIRTGRTMAEIERGQAQKHKRNPIDQADVQLAKLVSGVPEGDAWLFEVKFDGYRTLAFVEGNSARLMTRNGNDYTHRFQGVAASLMQWAADRAMVLDGEMVIADAKGRTDFQALQTYMGNPQGKHPTYIVFDLLALEGVDLRAQPLTQRKETLEALMEDAPENLCYSKHIKGNGKQSFQAACSAGLEGIIGKKADSVYSGTRNGDWVKVKCGKQQAFVIGGYTLSDKKESGISSLLLGMYDHSGLVFAGRAGTGLSAQTVKALEAAFEGLRQTTSPFMDPPKPRTNERFTWLQPEWVAEIRFAEWTEEKLLRQASFKGLQADKDPRTIRCDGAEKEMTPPPTPRTMEMSMETSNSLIIRGVTITSPDKVIFEDPQVTKAEVIRYYDQVSARMLPYVGNRIMSIVRCPKGVSQSCFYKKHPGPDSKGIVTVSIPTSSGEMEDYFYIADETGLIAEAQMGTLEFHTWGSRVEQLEKPDMMVFDLDPDEGMHLDTVRQGVRDIRGILNELSLIAYLKTSGGKGYHVVVPLKPGVSWEVFHSFARRVAEVMEQKWPDRYTSNVRKAKRTNKIFIDWIRNGRGATSIAPYAIRARKGARISMPITWGELDTVAPDGITMADALLRVHGSDPWQGFFQHDQMLK